MKYWLVKSDPDTYGWDDLVKDKRTMWDGVRNFQARNNLREMQIGDCVFVYESQGPKAIVGIAEVVKAPYADPTAKEGDWTAVDLAAKESLKTPVALGDIKSRSSLAGMKLVTHSRLSVMPVTEAEWKAVLEMAK